MFDDDTKAQLAALHRTLDSMAGAITAIVTDLAESEKAHAEKLEAQVVLVTKILELARPTVRALGSRPKILESIVSVDAKIKLASWRGLLLTPSLTGTKSRDVPITARGVDGTGVYCGKRVFLHEDGSLVELCYEGTWSEEPTLQGEWRAKESAISTEMFCRTWSPEADPQKLTAQLLGFMDVAGNRRKPTAKARELANKFRAIVTLL